MHVPRVLPSFGAKLKGKLGAQSLHKFAWQFLAVAEVSVVGG